jgi:hypothetical protein
MTPATHLTVGVDLQMAGLIPCEEQMLDATYVNSYFTVNNTFTRHTHTHTNTQTYDHTRYETQSSPPMQVNMFAYSDLLVSYTIYR